MRWFALIALLLPCPALADYLPEGYLTFCTQNPGLCSPQSGGLATVGQAEAVNRSVNAGIAYADDKMMVVGWTGGTKPKPLYVEDVWTISPKRGDCEDYAITKLAALLEQGVGRDHLKLALTRVNGVGHMILLVETPDGWVALDSLSDEIKAPGRVLAVERLRSGWQ